ncbi:protein scarlet-like [Polistes fuscatus]|uniref:protein scarlet-like n=1 Tax=Polistes fuscatus TaxID=30207 RepID=UPI001CA854FE|nr:protein scarlet-like [Polistes fuscatus]
MSMTIVSIFFIGNNPNTQKGMQNIRGIIYMMTSEIIFTVTYSTIYELPSDMINYCRETSMYGPGVYYVATFIGLIPKSMIKSLIFTLTILLTLNSNVNWKDIPFYCFSTTLSSICGTAYGMMMSSWTTDVDLTTIIMVPIDILFLLTAGMFYNLRSLPTYLVYLKYSSIFYYINECLSILYWSKIDKIGKKCLIVKCFTMKMGLQKRDVLECEVKEGLPCLINGTEVLLEYGYDESNFTLDLCGMICLTIFMSIFGYLGIKKNRTY